MKINNITLKNFGSYEGVNSFDTRGNSERNIVLIGGKNGAGKTTLFTAMRLCLYGYMSMGYKSINSFYLRAIAKLINNNAKLIKPAETFVELNISISNGHELDEYILTRTWVLTDSVTEQFVIRKNNEVLNAEETADFEKYLFGVIPPELFNLYFFDGEKIADFFLEDGSNEKIKKAFLTLCGYDTFDIMSKNFKRVNASNNSTSVVFDEYVSSKELLRNEREIYLEKKKKLDECAFEIKNCEAEIDNLESSYVKEGGITQKEWDEQIALIKALEKDREVWNSWLKKIANDMLPFLIVREQIEGIENQLALENNNRKFRDFKEVIENPGIKEILSKVEGVADKELASQLIEYAFNKYGTETADILELSYESNALVLSQIRDILDFDVEKISKVKTSIKKSINKCAKIRQELDKCNLDSAENYMKKRAELFEQKSNLLNNKITLEGELHNQEILIGELEKEYLKNKVALEGELKKESINDISAKAILMLDNLQSVLYQKQINKVEEYFRNEINVLMRKTKFIDDIHIDEQFNISIYRHEKFEVSKLIEILNNDIESQVNNFSNTVTYKKLLEVCNGNSKKDVVDYLLGKKEIELPVEVDQFGLSNGEKQIFIMALYHSLMKLCNHEIPFIIDTPFARIDTEHRENISKHFFSNLRGQVFILSTNEEINSKHVNIMNDKILAKYMLENTDNKKTVIIKNSYFEV